MVENFVNVSTFAELYTQSYRIQTDLLSNLETFLFVFDVCENHELEFTFINPLKRNETFIDKKCAKF